MSIHHDLEKIKTIAKYHSIQHNCKYNIILLNPGKNKEFTFGSTYEFVRDSYFEERGENTENVVRITTTDEY